MERFSPFLWTSLLILWIYVALGFCIPGALALLPRCESKDGELNEIRTLGRLAQGSLSIVDYEFRPDGGEMVLESKSLGLSSICVKTQLRDDILVISSVRVSRQTYEKTLNDHPEILAEAEKVLQLGRDKFAKAKKKLEQKSKPKHQPARLG